MSARITLHCDTVWREGACIGRLMTDAESIAEARVAARSYGWRTTTSHDYCPGCSGQGPQTADAVVAVLRPESQP